MFAAAMLVIHSATAMRADAAGLRRARGARSPMAMASPVTMPTPYEVAVTPTSATGTCQGPTIWSRWTSPVTVRSPIVMRKDLEPTVGRRRTREAASSIGLWEEGRYELPTGSNRVRRGWRVAVVRDILGGLPKRTDMGRSMGVVFKRESVTSRV
ncbi:hypothetical protein BC937DRAFT_89991 [Endogone sp. FLAS-F59071]|nr:hypothetical protein BC937DRAFT_89991 [Endogone sp. FLAS-F59071]|eukprot:RUS17427.1 hypothetical protein BC937DRAFT_89991 [Endogone sp. FLAS-F59071]